MAQGTNSNEVLSIPTPQAEVGKDCTWCVLHDQAVGGNPLLKVQITTNPRALALGESYRIAAGAIVLNQPVGTGETEVMARRAIIGRLSGGVYVSYHEDDPGEMLNLHLIAGLERTFIPLNGFTIT